ncbi:MULTISPECIES: LysR family transcriptional regulator [Gammaproteobacteria]|uniref:LysR family transcriptional regulator n=1 Tax=Gammaproteobacteria TaxID=1236 RepID=UPI0018692038|nr:MULTISPECIES: LysR family transcriptional regulator [Gammaproteobacteria]
MQIDLNLLRVFSAVAEQGQFAAAARLLSMPTSNISRAIKQLEQQLSCKLIDRTTRKMRLTEQGKILYQQGKKTLNELDNIVSNITSNGPLTGTFRLTIPSEYGSELLADILADFSALHPNLLIQCDTQLMPRNIIDDDIDLLLTFHRGHLTDSSYHSRLIKSWRSIVVASNELLEKTGIPTHIEQLSQMPCISSLSALEGQPWIFIDEHKKPIKITIHSHYRVNSAILAKSAVLKGLGFAILAEHGCLDAIKAGKLRAIEFPQQPATINLIAIYASRSTLSRNIEHFLEFLSQRL